MGLRPNFVLTTVSRHFILKQLQALDPKKAVGLDDLSSLFLRDGALQILTPIAHIVNISILSEVVPRSFCEAKVVPLFKKGSKLDPGNYRPVSILNVLSKILERAVFSQLSTYLQKRGLIVDNQSGFRSGFSTDSSLLELSDYVKSEIAKGNFVGMVLLDLRKAFDTVDHAILVEKLKAIGVDSVSWFESYLSGRFQCVEVCGLKSTLLPISCGVPQGSILGPLLFLIYINDMKISINCKLSLYADDSALLFSHSSYTTIADRLSDELTQCKRWLVDNRLSLHIGKTECLLFGSKIKLRRVSGFRVQCEGRDVQRVFLAKYLGVLLDENMSGNSHVSNVLKICAGRLSFLYRNSSLLDFQTRKTLCMALIQPHLDYCASSWYESISEAMKSRLAVVQRKMVRFINSLDNRAHVGLTELYSLSWLTVPDRVMFFKLIHLFKVKHGHAPQYLRSRFSSVSQTHSYSTRGSNVNFHVSSTISKAPSSFAFTAVNQWNLLPSSIKEIGSLLRFKHALKKYLLSKYS